MPSVAVFAVQEDRMDFCCRIVPHGPLPLCLFFLPGMHVCPSLLVTDDAETQKERCVSMYPTMNLKNCGGKNQFGYSRLQCTFWSATAVHCNRIAFFNGFVSLLAGASLNSPGRNNTPPNGYRCYVVGPLVFVAGGLLAIATVVFGVNYYILSSSLRKSTWGNTLPQHGQDGIVMGQPAYGGAQPYIPQQVVPPQAYTFQPFPQGTQYATVQYPGPSYPIYGQDSHAK